jgi:hypothetical protein
MSHRLERAALDLESAVLALRKDPENPDLGSAWRNVCYATHAMASVTVSSAEELSDETVRCIHGPLVVLADVAHWLELTLSSRACIELN